jgi:hypothetical protein
MKRIFRNKIAWAVAGVMVLTTAAVPQISLKNVLKAGGVIAVISAFGKDMNNGLNKLWGRKADSRVKTKVVPILSIGRGTAIGAVQVMGPPSKVDRVVAVAQAELGILGNEIRLRALIPISDKNVNSKDGSGLSVVDEVGVSGIIDLPLR